MFEREQEKDGQRILDSNLFLFPIHRSIDDDILKLVDEVDVDELVKEASVALEDEERFGEFVKEKVTMAIERFLVSKIEQRTRYKSRHALNHSAFVHLRIRPSGLST